MDVDKTSFSKAVDFQRAKGLIAAFVKYGDLWQQNGMAIEIPVDPFENKSLLETPIESVKGIEMANNIAAKHRGRRIFYCKNEEEVSKLIGLHSECSADGDAKLDAILVLLSEIKGVMLLNGYARMIKDKANPFDDEEVAKDESLELVASGMIPDDIAIILQEKKMLPEAALTCRQGKRLGKRLMQDNGRFFIGFYRS